MAEIIQGLGDLRSQFTALTRDMETRTARGMVVSAGGVLKKEAKNLAQGYGLRRTGAMINNIAIKRVRTPEGIAQYHLGVRHGRNVTKAGAKKLLLKVGSNGRIVRANDPFYWRFHEFGWVPRGRGQRLRGGERRRSEQRAALASTKKPATPFIGQSLKNKRDEAIEAMKARLARIIEKANKP